MKQATHTYPSLRVAAMAVLRIYQPLTTTEVARELNSWKHGGMLGFPYIREAVPMILDAMQEDEEIEYVAGLWRTCS